MCADTQENNTLPSEDGSGPEFSNGRSLTKRRFIMIGKLNTQRGLKKNGLKSNGE
jgi:hypothetical protein